MAYTINVELLNVLVLSAGTRIKYIELNWSRAVNNPIRGR